MSGCLPCTYHHQASVPDYSSTLVTLYQAMQGLPTHVPMVGGEVHMQPQARMSRMSNYVEHGL